MKAVLGTRKGALVYELKAGAWELEKAHFDGVTVSYVAFDRRSEVLWAGVKHGHWGPKLHFSKDGGQSFSELGVPKFPETTGASFGDFWAIASDNQGRLYCGAEPAALFYSDDDGKSWELNQPLFDIKGQDQWFGGGTDATCLHSVLVHPENPDNILVGISVAGCIETTDRGKTWAYRNKGLKARFLPDHDADIGQDPHKVVRSPSHPDVLWQQNHCGIFRSTDNGQTWADLSESAGLKSSFGWDIAVDESNPEIAYTVPALSDESRVPVDKTLYVQKTIDGGKSWSAFTQGLPQGECYDIVYRHALSLKDNTLVMGTTTGNLYASVDGAKSWTQLSAHLPPIYSVQLF